MRQAGADLDFAQEALRSKGCRELGTEHFNRDVPIVLVVTGEIDEGHAAAAEFTLDRVALSDCRLQAGEQTGHHATRPRGEAPRPRDLGLLRVEASRDRNA